MATISKQVIRQIENAESLLTAINAHKRRICSAISLQATAQLNPGVQEENEQQMLLFFDGMLLRLEQLTEQIRKLDLLHSHLQLDEKKARNRRDAVIKEATEELVFLKKNLLAYSGKEAVFSMGFQGETPRIPHLLSHKIRHILNRINEGVKLPQPLKFGVPQWETEQLRRLLKPHYQKLIETIEEVRQKEELTKGLMTQKWKAMEEQNLLYTNLLCIAQSMAYIAGEKELGERLQARKTSSRKKKKATQDPPLPLPSS